MGVQINGDTGNVIATKGTFSGDVGIGGTLTYEDVTNVDSVGLITARQGIKIGSGVGVAASISVDGNAEFAGIVTASSFVGSGANLTGVASTDNIRTNTNATFLKNINVSGIATVGSAVTISESGIEASGIGITVANINGGQIGGRRRLNINGGFQIFQRSTSASDIGGSEGYFAPDRYKQSGTGNMRYTASQSTDVPSGFGFSNSLKYDCTTASGTVSAGHFVAIEHRMEGQDVQVLCKGTAQAKQLTISFHVKSPKTGVHWVEVYDDDNDRHVCKSYTISSADTWQQVSLTFPGDTTGAFDNNNGTSLRVFFWLMAGTTYTGGGTPPSTWAAFTSNKRATGQVNVFDDTSNNFYITGIQFEVGSQATAFEHRTYGDELTLCQRYFQIWARGYLAANAVGSSDLNIGVPLTTPLRTTPTTNSGFSIHRSGNQTNTVSFVSADYQVNSIILEVRMSGFSVSDEVPYNVTTLGGSNRMEISAEF